MSKVILTDISNLQNENTVTSAVNSNNSRIEDGFDNTLSRGGQAPNYMAAELDMNSNRIINLGAPESDLDAVRYEDIIDLEAVINGLIVNGITVSTAIDVISKEIGLIDTYTAISANNINVNINVIRTAGYATIGDSGAGTYKRISTPSPIKLWHKQSADGAWWQLCDPTLNAKAIGAKGDNSTNNDTVFAAITDAVRDTALWNTVYFPTGKYKFASTWAINNTNGITLFGDGGRDLNHLGSGSCLIYTGTSTAINAQEAKTLRMEELGIAYNSVSFNGTMLDISCAISTWNKNIFKDLHFYGIGLPGPYSGSLVYALKSVDNHFANIRFSHAANGVLGAFNGTPAANSAANVFTHCDFVYIDAPIANPGLNWTFYGCRFEPSFTSTPAGIYCDTFTDVEGLSLHGCSFSDPTAAGTWIQVNNWFGGGIFGCTFAGDINLGDGIANINGIRANHFYGVAIAGNLFSGLTNAVVSTTTDSKLIFSGNSCPNTPTSVFESGQYNATSSFHGNNTSEIILWNRLPSYTVALLPNAAFMPGAMTFVSNEAGGPVPAFSDGTNWRRVTDRAIVS